MMLLSIDNLSDKLSGNLPPAGKHFTPFLRKDKDNDSVITRNTKVKKIRYTNSLVSSTEFSVQDGSCS